MQNQIMYPLEKEVLYVQYFTFKENDQKNNKR